MIVALIPARGGSKGVPRKNVADFCGAPLLAWTIRQAKAARGIDIVAVSTDDDEIAAIAESEGARVIRRPPELATDAASSEAALSHALAALARDGVEPTLVVFLQATSPLREPFDIENAVDTLIRENADSLFSAAPLHDFCIWAERDGALASINYDYRNRGQRQTFERQWVENGSIYVFKPQVLREHGNRLGGQITLSFMDFWKSFEVDDAESLELCRHLFRLKGLDKAAAQAPRNGYAARAWSHPVAPSGSTARSSPKPKRSSPSTTPR